MIESNTKKILGALNGSFKTYTRYYKTIRAKSRNGSHHNFKLTLDTL